MNKTRMLQALVLLVGTQIINAQSDQNDDFFPFSSHPTLYITHCGVFEKCKQEQSDSDTSDSYQESDNHYDNLYPEATSPRTQETNYYQESNEEYHHTLYPDTGTYAYPETPKDTDQTRQAYYPESSSLYTEEPRYYTETPQQHKAQSFVSKLLEYQAMLNKYNRAKQDYLNARNTIYNHNHDYNQATDTYESPFAEFEKEATSQKLYDLDAQYEQAMRTFYKEKKALIAQFHALAIKIAHKLGASAVHKYGSSSGQDESIIYVNKAFDITQHIVEYMNQNYLDNIYYQEA